MFTNLTVTREVFIIYNYQLYKGSLNALATGTFVK